MKCIHANSARRFLEPCLLLLLQRKADYGYNLTSRLKGYGFDESYPDGGTLYRVLRDLEQQGAVSSSWETGETGPAKRMYKITPAGKQMLQQRIAILKHNMQYISLLVNDYQEENT